MPLGLTINLTQDTTKGVLVLEQDGSFTYDYTADNAPDTDEFRYTITDANGTSNEAIVSLTIESNAQYLFMGSLPVNDVRVGGNTCKIMLNDVQVWP